MGRGGRSSLFALPRGWGGEQGEGRKGRAADDIFQLKKIFFSAPHSGERGNLGDLILALKY